MLQLKFFSNITNYSLFFLCFTNKFTLFLYFIKNLKTIFFKTIYAYNISNLTYLDNVLYGLLKGFKFYLEICSTSYKIKLINTQKIFGLALRIGYNHLIFVDLLTNFRATFLNKFLVCLYTNQLFYIKDKLYCINLKKRKILYNKKGIFWKNQIITLKKNKKLKF